MDETNLNRQIRSNTTTIGKQKVEVVKEESIKINPNLNMTLNNVVIDEENISSLINSNDLLIDAVGNGYISVLMSRACQSLNIPLVHAAVETTQG
ncbi:MAG: ThiF family adenylyltransferase [Methanosphaera sp.]|nr:ThiF family adenylyltransferase [Methanosphaera sp.]